LHCKETQVRFQYIFRPKNSYLNFQDFEIIKTLISLKHAVSVFVDPEVSNTVICIVKVNISTIKEICYTQDVIKVGGIVAAVNDALLPVLQDIVILVMVVVCGAVIQTTV
jgi:hypothetical protein